MVIRSTAELNGGEWACRTVGISQQLLHWDTNRHHSNRIRVRLIEHSPQTLDGFSSCKGGIQGIDRLKKNIQSISVWKNTKVFSRTRKLFICIQLTYWKRALLFCFQNIVTVNKKAVKKVSSNMNTKCLIEKCKSVERSWPWRHESWLRRSLLCAALHLCSWLL